MLSILMPGLIMALVGLFMGLVVVLVLKDTRGEGNGLVGTSVDHRKGPCAGCQMEDACHALDFRDTSDEKTAASDRSEGKESCPHS